QPPFIGPLSCAFDASTAFFQSAILAKVGAAGRMARHSVWVFSPQTKVSPSIRQQHPGVPPDGWAHAENTPASSIVYATAITPLLIRSGITGSLPRDRAHPTGQRVGVAR